MQTETEFIRWFTENGAWLSPKLAFKDYSSEGAGRGLVALDSFKEEEVLFKIPRKLLLSHKTTAHKSEVIRNASKEGWSRIMWSIVLERLSGPSSFWLPYFNIVPAKFDLPISWSEEDKATLEGTSVLERIGDPEADFKSSFAKLAKKFEATKALSLDQLRALYFYSGSLVSSYSFMEDDGTIVMVPMADMLNHRTGQNNARLFFEKDHLQMICIKDVQAGEQLYNTYGDLGNAELLFKYGYIDNPNEFSSVELNIGEFIEFAETHTCSLHNPSKFKLADFERLLDKGSIPDTVTLSRKPAVSIDLLKWIHRAYKNPAKLDEVAKEYKVCVIQFLTEHLKQYKSFEPANARQRVASELVKEQIDILKSYISMIRGHY